MCECFFTAGFVLDVFHVMSVMLIVNLLFLCLSHNVAFLLFFS